MRSLSQEEAKKLREQFDGAIDNETWHALGIIGSRDIQLEVDPPIFGVRVLVEETRHVPRILSFVDEGYHDNFRIESVMDNLPRQHTAGPDGVRRLF